MSISPRLNIPAGTFGATKLRMHIGSDTFSVPVTKYFLRYGEENGGKDFAVVQMIRRIRAPIAACQKTYAKKGIPLVVAIRFKTKVKPKANPIRNNIPTLENLECEDLSVRIVSRGS